MSTIIEKIKKSYQQKKKETNELYNGLKQIDARVHMEK